MYIVKDLVPDMTLFYKQYRSVKPYLQRETPSPDVRAPSPLPSVRHECDLTFIGSRIPPVQGRAQEARRPLRMHPLRMLLDLMPFVLVEPGRIPGPGNPPSVVPLDRRLARRKEGSAPGRVEQQHELVPLPHYSELLENLSKGLESSLGHCRNQEEHGFHMIVRDLHMEVLNWIGRTRWRPGFCHSLYVRVDAISVGVEFLGFCTCAMYAEG